MNSARGNRLYDVSDPEDDGYQIPGFDEAPLTTRDSDSWEPPDEVKGDIARSLFYMDIRYEGDSGNEPDLVLTDDLSLINSDSAFMGKLSTLLLWSEVDPVDDTERLRNDIVFEQFQFNRNPFIDHPEWARLIFEIERPFLHLIVEGESVVLSWKPRFEGFRLQSRNRLNESGAWADVPVSPAVTNGFWEITVQLDEGSRFYRLAKD